MLAAAAALATSLWMHRERSERLERMRREGRDMLRAWANNMIIESALAHLDGSAGAWTDDLSALPSPIALLQAEYGHGHIEPVRTRPVRTSRHRTPR
jgi:hypothetical protein